MDEDEETELEYDKLEIDDTDYNVDPIETELIFEPDKWFVVNLLVNLSEYIKNNPNFLGRDILILKKYLLIYSHYLTDCSRNN